MQLLCFRCWRRLHLCMLAAFQVNGMNRPPYPHLSPEARQSWRELPSTEDRAAYGQLYPGAPANLPGNPPVGIPPVQSIGSNGADCPSGISPLAPQANPQHAQHSLGVYHSLPKYHLYAIYIPSSLNTENSPHRSIVLPSVRGIDPPNPFHSFGRVLTALENVQGPASDSQGTHFATSLNAEAVPFLPERLRNNALGVQKTPLESSSHDDVLTATEELYSQASGPSTPETEEKNVIEERDEEIGVVSDLSHLSHRSGEESRQGEVLNQEGKKVMIEQASTEPQIGPLRAISKRLTAQTGKCDVKVVSHKFKNPHKTVASRQIPARSFDEYHCIKETDSSTGNRQANHNTNSSAAPVRQKSLGDHDASSGKLIQATTPSPTQEMSAENFTQPTPIHAKKINTEVHEKSGTPNVHHPKPQHMRATEVTEEEDNTQDSGQCSNSPPIAELEPKHPLPSDYSHTNESEKCNSETDGVRYRATQHLKKLLLIPSADEFEVSGCAERLEEGLRITQNRDNYNVKPLENGHTTQLDDLPIRPRELPVSTTFPPESSNKETAQSLNRKHSSGPADLSQENSTEIMKDSPKSTQSLRGETIDGILRQPADWTFPRQAQFDSQNHSEDFPSLKLAIDLKKSKVRSSRETLGTAPHQSSAEITADSRFKSRWIPQTRRKKKKSQVLATTKTPTVRSSSEFLDDKDDQLIERIKLQYSGKFAPDATDTFPDVKRNSALKKVNTNPDSQGSEAYQSSSQLDNHPEAHGSIFPADQQKLGSSSNSNLKGERLTQTKKATCKISVMHIMSPSEPRSTSAEVKTKMLPAELSTCNVHEETSNPILLALDRTSPISALDESPEAAEEITTSIELNEKKPIIANQLSANSPHGSLKNRLQGNNLKKGADGSKPSHELQQPDTSDKPHNASRDQAIFVVIENKAQKDMLTTKKWIKERKNHFVHPSQVRPTGKAVVPQLSNKVPDALENTKDEVNMKSLDLLKPLPKQMSGTMATASTDLSPFSEVRKSESIQTHLKGMPLTKKHGKVNALKDKSEEGWKFDKINDQAGLSLDDAFPDPCFRLKNMFEPWPKYWDEKKTIITRKKTPHDNDYYGIVSLWGKEKISKLEKANVNLRVACEIADAIGLCHPEPYLGVARIGAERAEWFRNARILMGEAAFAKTERAVRGFFEPFEGTRRIFAFRESIHRFTSAAKIGYYKDSRKYSDSSLAALKKYYGISEDPTKFLSIPDDLPWRNASPFIVADSLEILEKFMGAKKAKHRIELKAYMVKRKNTYKWWEAYDLEHASQRFATDVLKIMRIGDALQFGFDKRLRERSQIDSKPDKAYEELASIFFDKNAVLPWIESPERNWLHQLPGNIYAKRLLQLSRSVFDNSQEAISNPSIRNLLQQESNYNFKPSNDYRLGYELLWYDKGYPLTEFFALMEMRVSPIRNFFHAEVQKLTFEEKNKVRKWIKDIPNVALQNISQCPRCAHFT